MAVISEQPRAATLVESPSSSGTGERVGDVGQDHADEVGAWAAQITCGGT